MGVSKIKTKYFAFICFGAIIFFIMDSSIKTNKIATDKVDFTVKDLKKIKQLAEKGDSESQNQVGWMYDQGIGFQKDTKRAVKWYLKSANQGFWQAKINLGVMYELGRGVDQNFEEARKWYLSAKN